MNKHTEDALNNLAVWAPRNWAIKQWFDTWSHSDTIRKAVQIAVSVILGLALGGIVLFTEELPSKWAGLIILAAIAPTVALVVNDMKKLLLVALVVDIPLGLDIALGERVYRGRGTGFLVSLMTMALVVGYALWLKNRPLGAKSKVSVSADIAIPAVIHFFTLLVSIFQAQVAWLGLVLLFLEAQFLLMLFYLNSHVRTLADVRLILTVLALCLLLESILMIMQYTTGFELAGLGIKSSTGTSDIADASVRVAGTFGGANAAATFLASALTITFAAFLTDGWLLDKRLALIAFFPGILALLWTQSRNGWTGFALSMLILGVQALRKRIGVKALSVLLVVAVAAGVGFSDLIIVRFTESGQNSIKARAWHREFALNLIDDHMFTGVGLNNQRFYLDDNDYLPLELQGKRISAIHNTYLRIWAETGLFGLLAFVWLLLAAGRRALLVLIRSKDTHVSILVTGLLAALLVNVLHMYNATFVGRRMKLIWLIVALIAAAGQLAQKTDEKETTTLQSESRH